MKKKIFILLSVLILILSVTLTGCTPAESEENVDNQESDIEVSEEYYPITLKDDFGNEITIEKEPERIISLSPTMTETIYALGLGDKLVGRTDYCDYPEEIKEVDSIGTLTEPSLEKITELNPDLILTSDLTDVEKAKKISDLGFNLFAYKSKMSFEDIYETLNRTAKLFNKEENADKLIKKMKDDIELVQSKVKDLDKKDVYFVVGYGEYGDFTAGGDTFLNDLIELAGGNNVAKDVNGWKYSLEKLVEKDPEILICSDKYNSKEGIQKANGYKELTAVKNGNLYEINENLVHRSGPRITEGLIKLAKIIHPDTFK